MPQNTIHDQLRKKFQQANKELWRQTASKEVEGKDPIEILSWESRDKIKFSPYYEDSDTHQLNYLNNFHLAAGINNADWLNVPRLLVHNNERQVNKLSLEHLENGADGLLYVITPSVDLFELLNNIEWHYCSLFFRASENIFYRDNLREFIIQKKFDTTLIHGGLFWETTPKREDIEFYLTQTKQIKSLGIILSSLPPAESIAEALTQAVDWIEKFKPDFSVEEIVNAIAFSVPVDTNFFESVACLKSLRILWFQVTQVYGVKNYQPLDLHLHAHCQALTDNKYEPHSNMLRSTTAAMASALGGCNSLTVEEQDDKNTTMIRIVRNISSMLKDESYLNKVSDPVAGAYAADAMVHELSQKAWALLQSKIK